MTHNPLQVLPCEIPETMPHFEAKGIHNISLKPHQIMSIIRADKLEKYEDIEIQDTTMTFKSRVGMLCDKVGAGKTLTALGLIGHKPLVPNPDVFHFKSCIGDNWNAHNIHSIIGETSHTVACESTTLPLSIIVVPHTIFSQWENTIKTHTTIPYYGIRNKKTNEKFWEETSIADLKGGKYNIVLVTNKFFRVFAEHGFGRDITVSRVIYDEVDTLNIPRNGKILSNFYWGMTATYDTILHGTGYSYDDKFPNSGFIRDLFYRFRNLWSSQGNQMKMTFANRTYVASKLFIRNSEEFIESSFHLPEIKFIIHRCDAPPMVAVLQGVVSQEVMTLLNAGDVGGAINAVSCVKVDTQVSLIDVVTGEFKKELHNANIAYKAAMEYQYSSKAAKEKSLDRHKEDIAKLESKISNLRSRIEKSDMCPVCCGEIENTSITRCCNNSFCFECITKSLTAINSCPCCRANITQEDLIVMTDAGGGAKETEEKKRKEKGDAFSEIVNSNKEWTEKTGVACKYLIYSESYNTFHDVKTTLRENEISSGVVKGAIGTVRNLIEKYRENTNELQALMVNGKFAASGMNLENTTDVVIWHSMSKAMITQIIGRAQRPGRSGPLRVHFLAYPNELKDFEEYN